MATRLQELTRKARARGLWRSAGRHDPAARLRQRAAAALTCGTLTFWLAEAGIDKAAIGFFALVGSAYAWKFLWAPAIDSLPLPLLSRWLGRRRGWLLLRQAGLIASIVALGFSHPAD